MKIFNQFINTINIKIIFFWISIFIFSFQDISLWSIPNEYYPNYKIRDSWERIIENLVKIEAYQKLWQEIPVNYFQLLNKDFNIVLPLLPQKANYKVTYEQCLITSEKLSDKFTFEDMIVFTDRCFDPLNQLIQDILKNFSVQWKINASPKSWSAPLTVTFDARWSIDPSNDTIPADNYYWYYVDISWNPKIIWKWPVINHIFWEPWNYIVHLTVRSVNNTSQWVFDWTDKIWVDVWPKSADISIYLNSKKLRNDYKIKIWTQESTNWVIIDWSWTNPTWWRKILSHKWTIKSDNWFNYQRDWSWDPGSFRLQLWWEWEYSISLLINDNENNKIEETYSIIVSDPISTIKLSPSQWNTSVTYSFDAWLSYSINSKIKSYQWQIFDPTWNIIDNFEWKSFKKRFLQPWTYTIKLTVNDELWNISDDMIKLYVDSTLPEPQFSIDSVKKWKNPSEFIFDAWLSSDYDLMNWFDSLKYERKFSNNKNVKVTNLDWWNEKIRAQFNEPGVYTVKLIVTDKYNKSNEIEKKIDVVSSLRPELFVNPISSTFWSKIYFSVNANKTIAHYNRKFWDWSSKDTQTDNIIYSYESIWAYNLTLTVSSPSWETNELSTMVFVWEKWFPIAAYNVKVENDLILTPTENCFEMSWSSKIWVKSYSIDRYQNFSIDTSDAINSKWTKWDLDIYFKPINDEIYKRNKLSYKFSEVWCQYIDLWVEDTQVKKIDKRKIWFKVKNALPTLKNLNINFPQYWNESWVWFNQNNNKDMFSVEYDPLIVKVWIQWQKDSDWQISYFKWYYYKSDDPTKLLEVKVTPMNIPYAIFSVPKIPWQFAFWVEIFDNDWWSIKSEDVIWLWPTIFFQPDSKNPDIPLVTFKISKVNAKVWEEIKFSVIAKILSNKSDFNSTRIIKYDLDGDWEYEITTKNDEITYIYEKPWKYKPKVKVIYRWYWWLDYWDVIEVSKWLKWWFDFDKFDNKLLIRDTSYWEIEKMQYCMDIKNCKTNKSYNIADKNSFLFEYKDYWTKNIFAEFKDKYWNEDWINKKFIIEKETFDDVRILSVPKIDIEDNNKTIYVWKILQNSVLFNILYNWTGLCYLDWDITIDSDNDWNPENDNDLKCNETKLIKYSPNADSTIWRIYFEKDDIKKTTDIFIKFLDYDLWLTADEQIVYNDLTKFISKLNWDSENINFLKTLLINLRNNLNDKWVADWIIVQIQWLLEENENLISLEEKEILDDLIANIMDEAVLATLWLSEYEQAKQVIFWFIPQTIKEQVEQIFSKIEESIWNKEQIKSYLNEVYKLVQDQVWFWEIDENDMNEVKLNICKILNYYEIESKTCWTEQKEEIKEENKSTIFWTIFKIFWIIFLILVVVIVVIIVIFAIKARNKQQNVEKKTS